MADDPISSGPEAFRPNPGAIPPPLPSSLPITSRPFSYWAGRLMLCNPFYLGSGFLLLFGIYSISVDERAFSTDAAQFTFNFVSLQIYELMVAATAIVLARRLLANDTTVLVVLEHLLVLVPFLVVSEAAWVGPRLMVGSCLIVVVMAVLRWVLMRRWIPMLQLPRRLTVIGGLLLLINAVLPVLYRSIHEAHFEENRVLRPSYLVHECMWMLLLPVVCAAVNILPRLRGPDGRLLGPQRWLPFMIFVLWAGGTAVHLCSINFVYSFDFRREWMVPTLWVLAWTFYRRLDDLTYKPTPNLRALALVLPLVSTLPAAGVGGSYVFLILTALNLAAYGVTWLGDRTNRPARHLILATLAILFALLPWAQWLPPLGVRPIDPVLLTISLYVLALAFISKDPKVGLMGAIVTAIILGIARSVHDDFAPWAVQAGLIFLLLHSLRWQDREVPGAVLVRNLAALAWIIHAALWVESDTTFWAPVALGLTVIGFCLLVRFVGGVPLRAVVLSAAVLVSLCAPGYHLMFTGGTTTSVGILAMVASFVLFALGTLAALTKYRWLKNPPPS